MWQENGLDGDTQGTGYSLLNLAIASPITLCFPQSFWVLAKFLLVFNFPLSDLKKYSQSVTYKLIPITITLLQNHDIHTYLCIYRVLCLCVVKYVHVCYFSSLTLYCFRTKRPCDSSWAILGNPRTATWWTLHIHADSLSGIPFTYS